jgi:hypothetical protein
MSAFELACYLIDEALACDGAGVGWVNGRTPQDESVDAHFDECAKPLDGVVRRPEHAKLARELGIGGLVLWTAGTPMAVHVVGVVDGF